MTARRGAKLGTRISCRGASLAARVVGGQRLRRLGMAAFVELDQMMRLGLGHYVRQRRSCAQAQLTGPYRAAVYRRIWDDAAKAVGAEVQPWGNGYLLVRRGLAQTRVWQNLVPLGDPVLQHLACDKPATHAMLSSVGIPVPRHAVVATNDAGAAERFLNDHGAVVTKPARGTGAGSGVTGGVTAGRDLPVARARAARYDTRWLLLESMVSGEEYRVLVLDGVAIGAVRRSAPSVIGDGRTDIAGLVAAENARRLRAEGWSGIWPLTLDLDAMLALRSQGLTLTSVPPANQAVMIHTGVSQGSDHDGTVVNVGAPELAGIRTTAEDAAQVLGGSFVSVEIITNDPSVHLRESGGAVIEVNATPGLVQHYVVSNADAIVPVAVPVLQRLLEASSPAVSQDVQPSTRVWRSS